VAKGGALWGIVEFTPTAQHMAATLQQHAPIFSGESRHTLDEKMRVTVPSRWRSQQEGGDDFFLTVDRSGAFLRAMPPEVFQGATQKLANKPGITEADIAKFERLFYARSKPVTTDKQGRIILPAEYCASAGIKKEVVLVGTRASFEIYSPAAWDRAQQSEAADFDRLAELAGL
jgi:MraZ protein